jgi:uncharacterized membrane protein (UPF0127 family)/CheY-like chemotaxis protein
MFRRRSVLTLRREDGRIVCERVTVMDRWFARMRGLLGRRSVEAHEGVVLRPGFSIHTVFMRFPIDVVFLDSDLVVLKIDEAVRPFRTAACRGAREVVELRAGEAARRGLSVGDRVTWAPVLGEDAVPELEVRPAAHRGRALVASRDPRFVKLARVLLSGRGIAVDRVVPVDGVVDDVADDADVDVVLLDVDDRFADGLRVVGVLTAAHPDLALVVVGEGAAERAPSGLRVFDKWDETEAVMAAVAAAAIGDAEALAEEAPA